MLVSALRIPIPTTVQVHNLLPTDTLDESVQRYRPEYTCKLLRLARLEIVVSQRQSDSLKKQQVCLMSRTVPLATVEPKWQNLHEAMAILPMDEYETMKIRIKLSAPKSSSADEFVAFLEIPAHPSQLVRIGRVPDRLPVNSVVVHYTDGKMRISNQLYQALRVSGQSGLAVPTETLLVEDSYARFQDDAFRTLDQVSPVPTFGDDDGVPNVQIKNSAGLPALVDLDHDSDAIRSIVSLQVAEDELRQEIALLERAIQEEKDALAIETDALLQEKSGMDDLRKMIQIHQDRTAEIMAAYKHECDGVNESELMVKTHQISLFKNLQGVFPVSISDKRRYTILGLEVPSDLFAGTVGEDELSAALGIVCHLLHMMIKYLHVRSRYRLNCFSSRSAVQDDRGNIYPLFQTRGVDRDQLERGYKCLEGIASCIADTQQLDCPYSDMHILEKIDRIFDKVINGR
jgi:hypothetical protein